LTNFELPILTFRKQRTKTDSI